MDKIIKIREKWQKEYDETSLWSLFTGDDMVATLEEFIDDLDEIIKDLNQERGNKNGIH